MIALQEAQLEPGDVLLYRAANTWGNAMSVLIRKLDGTEVSHAGLYMGDGLVGESLIMGNTGLNTNPLAESVAGCDWVEVRRLPSAADRQLVLDTAWRRLNEGNCYGFDQILLVAGICLGSVRQHAHLVFSPPLRLAGERPAIPLHRDGADACSASLSKVPLEFPI